MAKIIRQSSAITEKWGPFVDAGDAVTPETSLTIQKANVRVSKNGGNMAAASADQGASDAGAPHDEVGVYDGSFDTTDTNTVGRLRVDIQVSGALPVFHEYQVVEEAVYDQFYAASALGAPTVAAVSDVKSQLVVVASDLLQVYSDTTRIDSNTVLAETNISDIESSLVIIKSDLVLHEAMLSDIESSLVIVKSDLIVIDDLASDVHSSLVIAKSDLLQVYSDTALLVPGVSDIESSLVIVKSDLVVAISDIADISAGSSPDVLADTTIATLASQTSFTLTAGSADNDVYNGMAAVFTDQSTATQKAVAFISDYVGSTKTVTLEAAPGFTIATGDSIAIMAAGASASSPPPAVLTGTQASQLTRVQSDIIVLDAAVSDVESSLVIVKSDLVVMDNLESDIHSSLVIARSDLLQVYSDTTRIDSNTVLAEINISDIESSLVIIKSDLVVIGSDIGDIIVGEGGLTPTQESQLTRIQSDLIVVGSDLLQVYSDTSLLVPGVSDIESSIVIIRSDQVVAEAMLSDVESSLVIVKSDLVVATSDTAAIESAASDIESSLVIVKSDLVITTSDTTALQAGVNVTQVRGQNLTGDGSEGDPWNPA